MTDSNGKEITENIIKLDHENKTAISYLKEYGETSLNYDRVMEMIEHQNPEEYKVYREHMTNKSKIPAKEVKS